jgi:hypothetical protein
MVRARHLGLLGLGLMVAACQAPDEYFRGADADVGMGQAGSAPTGAAGSIAPTGTAGTFMPIGAGGSAVTGTAGNSAVGTAGSSAGGSNGGTTGTAGTTGAAGRGGTTGTGGGQGGSSGRGGTTGAGGAGGTTGAGGAAGRGGTTGAGGAAGRGGTTGTGGAAGRGGTTGTAGRGGTTGTGGSGTCPTGTRLDCSAAASLDLAPDGQVVDFSTAQWNTTTARFCDAHGLGGTLSSFAGTSSTATAAVDTMAQAMTLNFMVGAGQYAGGRLNFNSCVDATGFNSIQFTGTVTTGSLTNCAWQIQLETLDQRPTTATPAGGTCNATTATCERYPAATLAAATTTATTYTTRFTAFNNPAGGTVAAAGQIVGLQWQVNSGNNGSGTCTVGLRIDNVRFVTQ